MLLVERQTPKGLLVSVCDRDVLGETFDAETGDASLTVDAVFYGEGADAVDGEAVLDSLARASVANLVGDETVRVAIEAGFVEEGNVLELEGTRHAQFLRM
ncbi:DUF424 domain-containing protein [Natrialbaceae archaeon A-CW3]